MLPIFSSKNEDKTPEFDEHGDYLTKVSFLRISRAGNILTIMKLQFCTQKTLPFFENSSDSGKKDHSAGQGCWFQFTDHLQPP
jgi:hypothetical protein